MFTYFNIFEELSYLMYIGRPIRDVVQLKINSTLLYSMDTVARQSEGRR